MAVPRENVRGANNIRGVSNIRNHTSGGPNACRAHEVYLRVACLEIEKHVQDKHRQNAMQRAQDTEERIRQIEAEKKLLMEMINGERRTRGSSARDSNPESPTLKVRQSADDGATERSPSGSRVQKQRREFRLQY